jgi:hypothetical protein
MASPGKTENKDSVRRGLRPLEFREDVDMHIAENMGSPKTGSGEGSIQTSTCKSDTEEH